MAVVFTQVGGGLESEPPVGIEPTTFSLRDNPPGFTRLHSSPLTCGNALNERCYDGLGVASTATELHRADTELLLLSVLTQWPDSRRHSTTIDGGSNPQLQPERAPEQPRSARSRQDMTPQICAHDHFRTRERRASHQDDGRVMGGTASFRPALAPSGGGRGARTR
jgi:hypothetical protein